MKYHKFFGEPVHVKLEIFTIYIENMTKFLVYISRGLHYLHGKHHVKPEL